LFPGDEDEDASDALNLEPSLDWRSEILEDEFALDTNTTEEFYAVPTFKIRVATQLHLVSKAVNAQVEKILPTAQAMREMIYLQQIISPSEAFFPMLSQSPLVLELSAGTSIYFLNNLPKNIRGDISKLLLAYELMDECDSPVERLWWTPDTRGPLFGRFIRQNFSNLQTLAMEVPENLEDME